MQTASVDIHVVYSRKVVIFRCDVVWCKNARYYTGVRKNTAVLKVTVIRRAVLETAPPHCGGVTVETCNAQTY